MSDSKDVRIDMLGGFSVFRSGRAVSLPTRKAAGLLAILASRIGTVFSRERLADMLWGRSAEAQARASLRQALAQLRKSLDDGGESVIGANSEGLHLVPGRVTVDVAEFETASAEGSPSALERAAQRYCGPFLDGFTVNEALFEDWRALEAERLRRIALNGMGRLLAHHVEGGAVEAATALAERVLAIDPAAEEAYQLLMRLHLGRGALGSAMREYERCKTAMATLGVPPSAATEALRQQVRVRPAPAEKKNVDPPLIAVLPFANLSDDAEQGYFARGFTEDVIRELAQFRSLRVIAAHSSFGAADPHAMPAETAARLGARYLLCGSVRRSTGSVRIGAELVDAESGCFLWSGRFDIVPNDIPATQDEIGRAVAATLVTRIDDDRLRQAMRKPLTDLAAYDCWLRGMAQLRHASPESHAEARTLFQHALEIDPSFARACSGLSLTYFNEWSCLAWDRWAENESRAFDYAQRGVRMDDRDPITHFILGRILLYRRQFDKADRHLQRAELLNPNDADILAQLAVSDMFLGHAERGAERACLAMRLNPFHDDWYFAFAAGPLLFSGRIETAIEYGLKAPDIATDAHAYLAAAFAHLGNLEEAAHHLTLFHEAYRRNIAAGPAIAPDETARWLMHVNPFRRDVDAQYFLAGLARAGLAIPADLQRPG